MAMTKREFEAEFPATFTASRGPTFPPKPCTLAVDYWTLMDFPSMWCRGDIEGNESRIVVKRLEEIIAYMVVSFVDRNEPTICLLEVAPRWRNMGIGKALVECIDGPCRACWVENVEFWKRLGFDFDPESGVDMVRV